jgi:hypothetical protein
LELLLFQVGLAAQSISIGILAEREAAVAFAVVSSNRAAWPLAYVAAMAPNAWRQSASLRHVQHAFDNAD